MANNNNIPTLEKQQTNLNFKDHQDFFDDYYDLKKQFIKNITMCYMDITLIPDTAISLSAFIMSNYAQLQLQIDFDTLEKRQKAIFDLIHSNGFKNDKNKALKIINEMKKLYSDIIIICKELELEPKPEIEQDSEEVEFWKKETHKGLREIKKGFMDVLSIKNG